jgi:hypothetical protein
VWINALKEPRSESKDESIWVNLCKYEKLDRNDVIVRET